MAEKERADGSKKFKLQGGPHDKMTVRLYPSNDGWERLRFAGDVYVAPDEQPARGKPVLNWECQNSTKKGIVLTSCRCNPKPVEGQPHSPACRFQNGDLRRSTPESASAQ